MPHSHNTRSSTAAAVAATAPTGTVDVSLTDTPVAKPSPPPEVQLVIPVVDDTPVPVPPLPSVITVANGTTLPIVADAYEVPQPEFAHGMGAATVNPSVNCYFAPHVLVNPSTAAIASTSTSTSPPSPSKPAHHHPIVTPMKATREEAVVVLEKKKVDDAANKNLPSGIAGTGTDTDATPSSSTGSDLAAASAQLRTAAVSEGARFALGTTNHTKKYTDRKKKILDEFVQNLHNYGKKYSIFLEITSDLPPSFAVQDPTEKLFVLLHGEDNKAEKVKNLNAMLIDWVKGKKLVHPPKVGSPCPAPSSLNTMVHTFFAAAKDYYDWSYSQKDFAFDGGYNGFFVALVAERRKEDVSIKFLFFEYFIFTIELILIHLHQTFTTHNNHPINSLIMEIRLIMCT